MITVYLQSEVQNHTFLVFLFPFPFGALLGRLVSLSLASREEVELLEEDDDEEPLLSFGGFPKLDIYLCMYRSIPTKTWNTENKTSPHKTIS